MKWKFQLYYLSLNNVVRICPYIKRRKKKNDILTHFKSPLENMTFRQNCEMSIVMNVINFTEDS